MKHFRICRQKNHHHQDQSNSPRNGDQTRFTEIRNQYPPHIQVTDVNDQALIIVQPSYTSLESKQLVNGNYNASFASTYV